MRIINRNSHDYYDCVQAQGADRSLTYVREERVFEASNPRAPSPYPAHLQALCDELFAWMPGVESTYVTATNAKGHKVRANVTVVPFVLLVAGRTYPGVRTTTDAGTLGVRICAYSYTLADFEKEREAYGLKPLERKHTRSLRWWNEGQRKNYELFFGEDSSEKYHALATAHRHPLLSLDRSYRTLTLDPTLNDFQFYRRLGPWQVFQELSMFMGNLSNPDNTAVTVSDKDRITQHGFDEYSFRKLPQAR